MFDPSDHVVDSNAIERKFWASSEYGHLLEEKKELLQITPQPRIEGFVARVNVVDDYASDIITRMSRTGFMFRTNCGPIFWCGKKENSAESSFFGSEFTAMKACFE